MYITVLLYVWSVLICSENILHFITTNFFLKTNREVEGIIVVCIILLEIVVLHFCYFKKVPIIKIIYTIYKKKKNP